MYILKNFFSAARSGKTVARLAICVCLTLFFSSQSIAQARSGQAPDCAGNYRQALGLSYKQYAGRLKYAVRISHNRSPIFSGQWIVSPSIKLGSPKTRGKRGRKKKADSLLLAALPTPHFSALDYTAQELQILRTADSIVRGRGKDPAFGKRGRYGWLTTRIAADLRVYMGQPAHPALCTGANLMMNHLYRHSGRLRKRIALVRKMAPLAHQYAAARYRALRFVMDHDRPPGFVKLGSKEKYASLNRLMVRTARLLRDRHTGSWRILSLMDREERFLQTVELVRQYSGLGHRPERLSQRGTRYNNTALSLSQLPVPRPDLAGKPQHSPARTGQQVRSVAVLHPTSARVADFSTRRRKLSALQKRAIRKTLAAIEAAYYIDHIHNHYDALGSSIFGAISSVRQSHARHCHCR